MNVSVLKKLVCKELVSPAGNKDENMSNFAIKLITALLTFSTGVVFNFAWINLLEKDTPIKSNCEEFVAVGLETEKIYRVTPMNPVKIPEETIRVCEDEIVLRPKD